MESKDSTCHIKYEVVVFLQNNEKCYFSTSLYCLINHKSEDMGLHHIWQNSGLRRFWMIITTHFLLNFLTRRQGPWSHPLLPPEIRGWAEHRNHLIPCQCLLPQGMPCLGCTCLFVVGSCVYLVHMCNRKLSFLIFNLLSVNSLISLKLPWPV